MLSLFATAFLPLLSTPAEAAHHAHAPAAFLTVDNQTNGRVSVTVNRDYYGSVGNWNRGTFSVEPGKFDVVVRDAQNRIISQSMEWLVAGQTDRVVVRQQDSGLVRFDNRTPARSEVFVDGIKRTTLESREDIELRLSTGVHWTQVKIQDHVVLSRQVVVEPWDEKDVRIDVALEGSLLIKNPLPVAVVVSTQGHDRRIDAHGSAYFDDLAIGPIALNVSRPNGESIAVLRPEICAFDTTRVEVPMPRVGVLEIRADDWHTFVVTIDGSLSRQFEKDMKLELANGRHRIEVRGPNGRIVLSETVQVSPFDVATLRVDDREIRALAYWDRDERRDDDRDEHGHVAYDGDTRR